MDAPDEDDAAARGVEKLEQEVVELKRITAVVEAEVEELKLGLRQD